MTDPEYVYVRGEGWVPKSVKPSAFLRCKNCGKSYAHHGPLGSFYQNACRMKNAPGIPPEVIVYSIFMVWDPEY